MLDQLQVIKPNADAPAPARSLRGIGLVGDVVAAVLGNLLLGLGKATGRAEEGCHKCSLIEQDDVLVVAQPIIQPKRVADQDEEGGKHTEQ